ncbi:WD40 repeat-like protein [Trichoderma longibrachiatum ATCC 18648]|uniref:ASTRA-associated protein 1 n=1 Tax=Trichoderma longibrachiatum ATCC 18648 TaxID=983965 RepID=A0A2T4CBZ7_TRILO|nr:WD40 repeat-like protein [Trichoderma longibrachiatum ATCC 18648]
MAESTPSPKAILRGHKAQIHAATFVRHNERLATGDAEGWVVLWDLTIMRPRAVWRAHENAILGIRGWGRENIITHGRDHKLIVWRIREEDEGRLSVALPLEETPTPHPQPWVLHLLEVNTMNFCSFAACLADAAQGSLDAAAHTAQVLIAVPNTLASEAIDIYALPGQTRIHTIKSSQTNGMAMSLSLFHREGCLTLVAAFENGFVSVHGLDSDGSWTMTYRSQAHTQPVLSIDVHPNREYFFSSAADALIAKHPVPVSRQEVDADAQHNQRIVEIVEPDHGSTGKSLLSAALNAASPAGTKERPKKLKEWEHPLKVVNTRHSGQQSLRVRSDGKLLATAGWDSKIRIYSAKTLKELAVLSWHKVGAYAVAFASVDEPSSPSTPWQPTASEQPVEGEMRDVADASQEEDLTASRQARSMTKGAGMSVKDRRLQLAKTAHWIAAGAKDGKVSLWDIY